MEATMKSPVLTAAVLACVAACGSPSPPREQAATSSNAIQGGTNDSTHSFAVGVVLQGARGVALCSGALLGPNLVATARHCVSQISSTVIDCATSSFGAVRAAGNVSVTTDPTISRNATLYGVSEIMVPSGSNQTSVCGNDLALLILSQAITLPQYVTPAISPPMTDHRAYTTTVTAIGYGVSTPTDTTGATSGVRRIKENVDLVCIPNDTTFVNCFPAEAPVMSANEFLSNNGTCEGDSGSSAFEQRSFNNGSWVSFGVLSRGGVDADGGTCVGGIYTRFDAWGQLIIDAACQAASVGGYPPPSWADCSPQAGDAGDAAQSAAPEGGPSSAFEGGLCMKNDTPCNSNVDCCSANCLSHGAGTTFACAACDSSASPCDMGYTCHEGTCVPTATQDDGGGNGAGVRSGLSTAKGCTCAALGGSGPFATSPWREILSGLGLVGLALVRRRRG
jgi:V8-like Glu-specific endopeptidase